MYLPTILLCLLKCITISTALIVKTNTENLISVVQVYRHGQRNPGGWYPNDPWRNQSVFDLGPAQLTKDGKVKQYELGEFSRGRYGSFLPANYNSNWFRAQTTDTDRTHMSCQANLAAFFKPTKNEIWNTNLAWQPIPVHPANAEVFTAAPNCAIYLTEFANVLVTSATFEALNKEYAEIYEYLTNHTGTNVTSAMAVYSIYDTLHVEVQLGFELPEWAKSVYPEPLRTITGIACESFAYTTEQKRLTIGIFLKKNLHDYFTSMFEDPSSNAKYQMWSGHEANIAAILSAFGAFEPHYPAFASTLYFELRNISGLPFINIYHMDEDLNVFEPITIEGCAFDCSLNDFSSLLSKYFLDEDTWKTECAATVTSFTDTKKAQSDERVARVLQYLQSILSNLKK